MSSGDLELSLESFFWSLEGEKVTFLLSEMAWEPGGRSGLSAMLSILTFAAGCGVQQNFLRWLGTAGSLELLALGASSRSLSLSSGNTENDAILRFSVGPGS